MPSSFCAASPENDSTVASCDFQPKRPARSGAVGASSRCTQCTRPLTFALGGVSSRAAMAASGIASIRPMPSDEVVTRVAVVLAAAGTVSTHDGLMPACCSSEPPNAVSGSKLPLPSV